jgi:hypothetical protein
MTRRLLGPFWVRVCDFEEQTQTEAAFQRVSAKLMLACMGAPDIGSVCQGMTFGSDTSLTLC